MNKCECCGKMFTPTKKENTYCEKCVEDIILNELNNEARSMIEISREMALDAGYPQLEGQIIGW